MKDFNNLNLTLNNNLKSAIKEYEINKTITVLPGILTSTPTETGAELDARMAEVVTILRRCYPDATPSGLLCIAASTDPECLGGRLGSYNTEKGYYWVDAKNGRVIYNQYQETGKDLGRWFIFYDENGEVSRVDTTFLDHLTEELNGCKTAILKQCFPDATRNDLIYIANHVRKDGGLCIKTGKCFITYEFRDNIVYELEYDGTQFFTIDGITKQIDADGEETTFDAKSWSIYQG